MVDGQHRLSERECVFCAASQANSTPVHFEHKGKKALCIHGLSNPGWVQEQLPQGSKEASKGFCVEATTQKTQKVYRILEKSQKPLCVHMSACGGENDATTTNSQSERLVALLKACTKHRDLHQGNRVHADIVRHGLLEKEVFVGNTLVNMYAKCGALEKAQDVFDELPAHNIVSWNALLGGYAEHGQGEEAIVCFNRMQKQGLSPDSVTFLCILKACSSIGASDKGQEIHDQIVKARLLEKNIYVGSALVDMYASCGELEKAQEVFDKLPMKTVVSWNALIAGYARHGHGEEALHCFEQMQLRGFSPNAITFVCIVKACGSLRASNKGHELHAQIVRDGLLKKNILVANALIDMHAKCGALEKAQEVFDELPAPDAVSWNALIGGYVQHGHGEHALKCFEQMQLGGVPPTAVTFVCILKACSSIGDSDLGHEFHTWIARDEVLIKNIVVANALVDMYAKCGAFEKAQEVFNEIPVRDAVLWNALITGHAQHEHYEETLTCFEKMQLDGFSPDAVTFACVLNACGSIGATYNGLGIHAEVVRDGLLEKNVAVGTALVDMYAKFGLLREALELFHKLPDRDVVSWNVLMAGYAQFGMDEGVFDSFDKLIGEGNEPNCVTFTILLNTCSHRGLLEKGELCFEVVCTRYGIIPALEHHICMIDLFGRAGLLGNMVAAVAEMPHAVDYRLWHTLLSACQKWGNMKLGKWAFDHLAHLREKDAAAFVNIRNMYSAAGQPEDAYKLEAMRMKKQAEKKPGHCCWTDASGVVHTFISKDKTHPQIQYMYAKLESMALKLSQEGYSSDLLLVFRGISHDLKTDALCGHNEMFAIALALINTSEDMRVHVFKNTQMCGDCHSATALISKLEKRIIFVRDAHFLHVFEGGKCMCWDCW